MNKKTFKCSHCKQKLSVETLGTDTSECRLCRANKRREQLGGVDAVRVAENNLPKVPAPPPEFPITPHVLRHSCATHYLKQTGDLYATARLMGHASIASTEIYTSYSNGDLASIYAASFPR